MENGPEGKHRDWSLCLSCAGSGLSIQMVLLAPANGAGIEGRPKVSRKALLVVTRVRGSDLAALCPDGANGLGWTQAQEGDLDEFEESIPRHGALQV